MKITRIMIVLLLAATTAWAGDVADTQDALAKAQRVQCLNNLHQIGLFQAMFETEYMEAPQSLQQLAEAGGADLKLFVCPKTGNKPGSLETLDEWSDYELVAKPSWDDDLNATVIAFSKPYCYPGQGGNVLFSGGQVKWLDMEDYTRVLASVRAPEEHETATVDPLEALQNEIGLLKRSLAECEAEKHEFQAVADELREEKDREINTLKQQLQAAGKGRSGTDAAPVDVKQLLDGISIPRVDFRGARLEDVVDFMSELLRSETPPDTRINLVLLVPDPERAELPTVTLSMSKPKFIDVLQHVVELTGLTYEISDRDVLIRRPGKP